MPWYKKNPKKSILHSIWILVNLLLGLAASSALIRSPIIDPGPLTAGLLISAGTLLPAAVWAAHAYFSLTDQSGAARGIRRAALAAAALAFLIPGALAFRQAYQFGMLPPMRETHSETYDRLWRALDRAYPYFDDKDLNQEDLYSRYRARIAGAETAEEFHREIGALLLEFNDTHTGLMSPRTTFRCCFAVTREIEGRAFVTAVNAAARQAGLSPGDEILQVRGEDLDTALERVLPQLKNGSSPWQRRANAFYYLLSTGPREDQLTVKARDAEGQIKEHTLRYPESSGERANHAPEPIIQGERLSSGIGLIKIPQLYASGDHDLIEEFDAALAEMMDAPGIILDLRASGGGSSTIGDAIAGRFLEKRFLYGREHYPQPLFVRGLLRTGEHSVSPRGETYTGPVVVLIDERTVSSSEWLAAALLDSGRAFSIGRTTAGATGNPLVFKLGEGGLARFSSGDFYRADGSQLEGQGITPDYPVTWSVDDVRSTRDPDLTAAEKLILEPMD